MTSVDDPRDSIRFSGRRSIVAALVIMAVAALVFYRWRAATAAPPDPGAQDTLCMAGRLGLPCR